jgi:hypothetical protein
MGHGFYFRVQKPCNQLYKKELKKGQKRFGIGAK